MRSRLDKTLADYAAIAISPALIMGLVGSLVFFLLEVFYRGGYPERLHFIMAMFVMAAVLIGRISIEEGTERAAVFALPLGVLTAAAVYRFVSNDLGPLTVSISLLVLIWWAAHKLTWDCTLIDEEEDASGEGLLQAVGLDELPAAREGAEPEEPEDSGSRVQGSAHQGSADDGRRPWRPEDAIKLWWERLFEREKRPHAPGVWIVYFSLAALPVFGIGQRLIPAADVESRQYAFWLLCIYVASGLGLLITTSFLGLRRYLRQRRLQMPAAMAGVWLSTGCVLAVALLAAAALLPRPASEYAVSDLPFGVGAVGQRSSPYAVGDEGVDDDRRPQRPGKPAEESERAADKEQKPADQSGGRADGEEPGEDQGGGQQQEDASGGKESQESGSGEEGKKQGRQGDASQQEQQEQQDRRSNNGQSEDSREQEQREGRSQQESREQTEPGDEQEGQEGEEEEGSSDETRQTPSLLRKLLPETGGQWLTTLFRWVLYGVLIVVGGAWLWRNWRRVYEGFRQLWADLRAFWERLFGAKSAAAAEVESDQAEAGPRFRPFSDFPDPFATGLAEQVSPDELVRYSFEALEAWARERGWPRGPEQTPHEFAQQVGTRATPLSQNARRLADLYSTVAYARSRLPAASVEHLRRFWQELPPAAARDMTSLGFNNVSNLREDAG